MKGSIEQILQNLKRIFYLLTHEKVKIEILARPCENTSSVEILFEDYGPGIPDARKDEVLNIGAGKIATGLGLTLVSDIVRYYEGSIWLEDRIPDDHTKGTRVVIRLPLHEQDAE